MSMEIGNWLFVNRYSIDEVYANVDYTNRFIFQEDALDAGECMMSTSIFIYRIDDIINIIIMHSPTGITSKYYCQNYLDVSDISQLSNIVYDTFDKLHILENTIHFDYVQHICTTEHDTLEMYQLKNNTLESLVQKYVMKPVQMECEGEGEHYFIFKNIFPTHLGNYIIFNNIRTMSTIQLKFTDIYNWYNNNQTNPLYFSPCTTIQYRYIINVNNSWKLSTNIGNVSLAFDYINNEYLNSLKNIFGSISNKGIYLQLMPNDIYFVVPTLKSPFIFGDHYRIHHINSYNPDWNRTLSMVNVIDIHRTVLSNKNAKHDPKCVFNNEIHVPIISNKLNLDTLVCHNKKPGTGFSIFKNIFENVSEKQLVEKILTLPYEQDIQIKTKAANTIIHAWKNFKAKGGSIVKYGKRGGIYMNNKIQSKEWEDYESKFDSDIIDYVYVNIIEEKGLWFYTINIYSKYGQFSFVTSYGELSNLFIIERLNNLDISNIQWLSQV